VTTIGSGGNINKLVSLLNLKPGKVLGRLRLQHELERISGLTVTQRIRDLGLRPDRADVLPHALRIYLFTMQHARSTRMVVPQSGLADGLVRELYEGWKLAQGR
jgi:exopolyphosphatase/guanosine-5'-triphosphate,3'-diphosphate pyrophosphatase